MSAKSFFTSDARERAARAIGAIESETAGEIVISAQHRSGHYRDADYVAGFALTLVALFVLLFDPHPFPLWAFPLDAVIAFALGAAVTARVAPVRRVLITRSRARGELERAARSKFVELGVSRTRGRTGVLVYASLFERGAAVVADIGVDVKALGAPWQSAIDAIETAVARADFDAFESAVRSLGPVLATQLPRAADDVNELPDQMETA